MKYASKSKNKSNDNKQSKFYKVTAYKFSVSFQPLFVWYIIGRIIVQTLKKKY